MLLLNVFEGFSLVNVNLVFGIFEVQVGAVGQVDAFHLLQEVLTIFHSPENAEHVGNVRPADH